jgi:predicted ABC-type ATPase
VNLPLDQRPILVAIAGPNGAGKTVFYHSHIEPAGLRFVNTDVLAKELGLGAYEAASLADVVRRELLRQRESFVFETVFSDPVRNKIGFLQHAASTGYTVVLCFIGISGPDVSEQRVAMRVTQGGHDVPTDKLISRFGRTLENLGIALRELPHVWIFDNDDLRSPFRVAAIFESGNAIRLEQPVPDWLEPLL